MMSPNELRDAVRSSKRPVSQIAELAGVAPTTLYSFMSGATGSLRASAHTAVETALSGRHAGVSEERAAFGKKGVDLHPSVIEEAKTFGIDVEETARKAVEEAVKRARIELWVAENCEAFAAHARDINENGLWSDGLRLF